MNSRPPNQRFYRFALFGAVLFGLAGFSSGVALCLHFKLPIPPLFLTEMGVLLGGCLGALASYLDFGAWLSPPTPAEDGWETYRG